MDGMVLLHQEVSKAEAVVVPRGKLAGKFFGRIDYGCRCEGAVFVGGQGAVQVEEAVEQGKP